MATALVKRSPKDWEEILVACGATQQNARKWAEPFADEVQASKFSLGEEELDDFLGQILHESGMLQSLSENLNYSAKRIRELGAQSGPGTRWYSIMDRADKLANNPEALANALYSNRGGNGDEASGDGYRFRGRGPIQLTFKNNYIKVGELIGQDLEYVPELMEQPRYSLIATIAWWEGNIPDSFINDITKVTKRVNGGTFGIQHRLQVTQKARKALDDHMNA